MTPSLCQRPRASCGACCGLYAVAEPSRDEALAELRRRTRALARAARTPDAFRAAVASLARDAPAPRFPSIRVCSLLGFLDEEETRVGCLAHPRVTGGADLRACGAYDVETCESFLCASHAFLSEREARIVERATDAYLYGLVATDAPFVRAVLAAIEAGAGRPIDPADLDDARFRGAVRRLFGMKELLAPGSDGLFGAFKHPRPEEGAPPRGSGAEAIVEAAGADERSGNDPEALEHEAARRLAAARAALPGARR